MREPWSQEDSYAAKLQRRLYPTIGGTRTTMNVPTMHKCEYKKSVEDVHDGNATSEIEPNEALGQHDEWQSPHANATKVETLEMGVNSDRGEHM